MTHIKITDLSIGDWVMYNLDRYRVVQIDEESEHVVISGAGGYWDKHIDYIEPICIKTDMLFQNGFNTDNLSNKIWLYANGCLAITYFIEGSKLMITHGSDHFSKTIKYVHELQRAFRTMGLTKEFEL